jgi:tetratricopeptide (TPR) repeat protein
MRNVTVQPNQEFALADAKQGNAGEPASQFVLQRIEAPTRDELVSAVMERGDLEKLVEAQKALSRNAPGIPLLSNGTMRMLALKFLDDGEKDKAITALQLLVDLYPADAHMLNTLGDLYLERNERGKAAWCYQQSLSARPANGTATERLNKLERMTP